MLQIGGVSNGVMTDAELLAYLIDTNGEVTNVTVASFTRQTEYGY